MTQMRHRHRSRLRVLVCLPVDLPKLIRRGTNHQIEETFHPTPRRFRVRQRNFSSKEDAGPYHYQLRNVRARPKQHHLTRRSVRKQWNRIERFSVTEFVPFGALPRSLRSTWRLNAGFSRCTAQPLLTTGRPLVAAIRSVGLRVRRRCRLALN